MNVTEPTEERDIPTISVNNLLIPALKQEEQTTAFFDDLTNLGNDRLQDYTDVEGLLNEQSLIIGSANDIDNNGREEMEINENLINFESGMANQQLKLPLKDVAKIVPELDGKNMESEEYIERLHRQKTLLPTQMNKT